MSNIYEGTANITYYDLDYRGKLKLSAILRIIHIAADINATAMGVGYTDLSPLNISFVIQRFGLDVDRLPEYGEKVTVRTWPTAITSGVFMRKGDMHDASGKHLMNWESLWILFSLESRSILKSSALPTMFECEDVPGTTAKAKKIILPADGSQPFSNYKHTVCYSEVDTNRHMNNSIYGDLTGNALYKKENPAAENWREVQINFLSETRLGDEIDVDCREVTDGGQSQFFVSGSVRDKKAFAASVRC